MRGATTCRCSPSRSGSHFNPRSSCEERLLLRTDSGRPSYFNPRSSCEERLSSVGAGNVATSISIHAPHARSDEEHGKAYDQQRISIHAPHARSDWRRRIRTASVARFQSTLLMRGATAAADKATQEASFQSTLLMRGATFASAILVPLADVISIHAPHARSDVDIVIHFLCSSKFQSTLLMRGATRWQLATERARR